MLVQPETIELRVIDNGIGIRPDLVPHVFGLFTQADRSKDRSQGGLGIGLAIAQSLVHLHGGEISVTSAGLGMGSEFRVQLPRIKDAVKGHSSVPTATEAPVAEAKTCRILIVDDNVDAADLLGLYLETIGHEVAVFYDAKSALERAAGDSFEVCLLDIGLPDMNGIELARKLSLLEGTQNAVFIAITGYGQPSDRADALSGGFHHHMVKSIDPGELTELIANIQ